MVGVWVVEFNGFEATVKVCKLSDSSTETEKL